MEHLVDCIQQSVADWCRKVPAGGLSPDLTPESVAPRELLEEVDGRAAGLRYVGQFYTSNGISTGTAYVYLAAGVACLSSSAGSRPQLIGELGLTHCEPTELIEVRLVPLEKALHMAREGEISDGPSALAVLRCQPPLGP